MSKLWRNYTVHNLIGHPLCEICYWLARPFGKEKATKWSEYIHDVTLPLGFPAAGNPRKPQRPRSPLLRSQ